MDFLLPHCTEIKQLAPPSCEYSICSLVNNRNQYEELLKSFVDRGFSFDDCEYLYADNSSHNNYDAYTAYNLFFLNAKGKYVIFCHQDVRLLNDGRKELDRIIAEMNQLDSSWAVLGNAGGIESGELRIRISDRYGENIILGPLPAKVQTVDENFFIVRRAANLAVSGDLAGFHFYGADICLVASILGYSAYVVNFHLRHLGEGSMNMSFFNARLKIAAKYSRVLRSRWVRTTCTTFFISENKWLSRLLNSRIALAVITRFPRLVRAIMLR
jgi:hypothetical protein